MKSMPLIEEKDAVGNNICRGVSILYSEAKQENSYRIQVLIWIVLQTFRILDSINCCCLFGVLFSQYYTCRSSKMKFDIFGHLQRNMLAEHVRKGDTITSCNEGLKNQSYYLNGQL
jgi:hypothetical protein